MTNRPILFVTNDNLDAVKSRVRLCEFLISKGHRIHLLYPEGRFTIDHEEITLHRIKKRGISIQNFKVIFLICLKFRYQTVILRGIESIILSIPILFLSKVKIVFFLTGLGRIFNHNDFIYRLAQKIYIAVLKILLKRKRTRLIVQNAEDKATLNISSAIIINGSGIVDSFAESKNIRNQRIQILTATRLLKSKGLESILAFARKIQEENMFDYTILGDYDLLESTYKNQIFELNQFKNIHFLGFRSDVTEFIKKSHYAFFPTQYREGSPRFLIESISYGLIPITTKAPGCSPFLNYGFEYKSPELLITQLKGISNKTYSNLSKMNIEFFKENYSESVVFAEYKKVIDE